MRLVAIRETPLDVTEVVDALGDDGAGGLTLFIGQVRDHDGGKGVDALDYSAERLVVYVAATPPRPALRQLAQRMDKKIVYVPLGQLSPVALKRLRVFHVLSDRNVRAVAHRYIRD